MLELGVEQGESAVARSRLEQAVAQENATSSRPYLLSLSVGMVAFTPSIDTTLDEMLVDADEAMYTEKRQKTSRPDFPAVVLSSAPQANTPARRELSCRE